MPKGVKEILEDLINANGIDAIQTKEESIAQAHKEILELRPSVEEIENIIRRDARITCNPPIYLERQLISPEELQLKIYNSFELAQAIHKLITEKME